MGTFGNFCEKVIVAGLSREISVIDFRAKVKRVKTGSKRCAIGWSNRQNLKKAIFLKFSQFEH
jgi:hypothetical protein